MTLSRLESFRASKKNSKNKDVLRFAFFRAGMLEDWLRFESKRFSVCVGRSSGRPLSLAAGL